MSADESQGWAARRAKQKEVNKGKKTAHKRRMDLMQHATEGAAHGKELMERAAVALGDSHNPQKRIIADMVSRALQGDPIQPKEVSEEEADEFAVTSEHDDYDDSDSESTSKKGCFGGGGKTKGKQKH